MLEPSFTSKQLKDRKGRLIGVIKSYTTGDEEAWDADGELRGTFKLRDNATYCSKGDFIGTGNFLSALLVVRII
jgi:hypothetical protein